MSGGICAMFGCNNYMVKNRTLSYFRFPRDNSLCKKWVDATRRLDLHEVLNSKGPEKLNKSYRVCSAHFEKKCFRDPDLLSQGLVKGALPTLRLHPDPSPNIRRQEKSCLETAESRVSLTKPEDRDDFLSNPNAGTDGGHIIVQRIKDELGHRPESERETVRTNGTTVDMQEGSEHIRVTCVEQDRLDRRHGHASVRFVTDSLEVCYGTEEEPNTSVETTWEPCRWDSCKVESDIVLTENDLNIKQELCQPEFVNVDTIPVIKTEPSDWDKLSTADDEQERSDDTKHRLCDPEFVSVGTDVVIKSEPVSWDDGEVTGDVPVIEDKLTYLVNVAEELCVPELCTVASSDVHNSASGTVMCINPVEDDDRGKLCIPNVGETDEESQELDRTMSIANERRPALIVPLQCVLCGLILKNQAGLTSHVKNHCTRKVTYKCAQCGRCFNLKPNLQTHLRLYCRQTCWLCGNGIVAERGEESRGPDGSTSVATKRGRASATPHDRRCDYRLQCILCGKTLTSQSALTTHMQYYCNKRRMAYQCRNCSRSFNLVSHLQTHMRLHCRETCLACQNETENLPYLLTFGLRGYLKN